MNLLFVVLADLMIMTTNGMNSVSKQGGNINSITFQASCLTLSDGLHYVKPSEDGAVIPVMCDSGYTIVNIALDQESVSSHFTSFFQFNWNMEGVYSGDCDLESETSSWRDWWGPATMDTKFRVSPDCVTCEASPSYGDNTGYYMTNYYFCWNKHHSNTCDYSGDELKRMTDLSYDVTDDSISMCNVCDDDRRASCDGEWCDCLSLRLDADTETSDNHDNCVLKYSLIVKPTVNGGNQFCTCYQQSEDTVEETEYTVEYGDNDELNALLPQIPKSIHDSYRKAGVYIDSNIVYLDEDSDSDTSEEDSIDCDNNKHYLSNRDFVDGTFRIRECGEYIFTEDILINFNPPSEEQMNDPNWSPNDYNYDNFPWYPSLEQQEGDYNGLEEMRGTYQAGFFAGITIECDDVTIDLNNHKIEMEYIYYLQQRFFTLISLGNRPFIGDQGPGNFGRQTFHSSQNIVIKNGEFGRSSHHGIHGNGVENLEITNVRINTFDITGLQCNGCNNAIISDSIIGPQNNDIPVLGKYTHGRALLPRLKYFVENYGDEVVTFGGKYGGVPLTITDLADELVEQLDLIYFHIVDGIDYENDDEYDEQWSKATQLFLNPTGYNDGGSSYGLFLNGLGTGVVSFGRRMTGSSNIKVQNVEIFGIHNQPWERFWSTYGGSTEMQGFFFDPLDWEKILDEENGNLYKGDAYHDLVFAAEKVASKDEFCLFNTLFVSPIIDWVFEDDTSKLDKVEYQCGSDVQSHDAKGTIGFRVDSVQDLSLENIHIHDINNYGELGTNHLCGEWELISFVFKSFYTVEPGYTATRAHGFLTDFATIKDIKNMQIENIASKYGTAIGASIYQGTKVHKLSNINVINVNAGYGFESESEVDALTMPNFTPRACSLEIGETDDEENYPIILKTDTIDDDSIMGASISGYDMCLGEERIGDVYDDLDKAISAGMVLMVPIERVIDNNSGSYIHTIAALFGMGCVLMVVLIGICFMCKSKFSMLGKDAAMTTEKSPLLIRET